MNSSELTDILLKKLTNVELSALCNCYDDGSFNRDVIELLLQQDAKNNPKKYAVIPIDAFCRR